MYYLAGDIGGTKALLQLVSCQSENNQLETLAQQRYACADFDSLESIILDFLHSYSQPSVLVHSACFGLPGPVYSDIVNLTNLPWIVSVDSIKDVCGIKYVHFINDFTAAALGIDTVSEDELLPLYLNRSLISPKANRLVVGAGTGLGIAPVYFDGHSYLPQASEGGHFDFAPISDAQQLLLQWLWQRWEHVSYERLLSGSGLEVLYCFFKTFNISNSYEVLGGSGDTVVKNHFLKNDAMGAFFAEKKINSTLCEVSAPQISKMAEEGDECALKAVHEFVTIYGAFIGAMTLLWPSANGVYIAGGVAPKLLKWMQMPFFTQAYLEKGRMTKLLETTPVFLVANESLGLNGAMRHNFSSLAQK